MRVGAICDVRVGCTKLKQFKSPSARHLVASSVRTGGLERVCLTFIDALNIIRDASYLPLVAGHRFDFNAPLTPNMLFYFYWERREVKRLFV